MFFAVFVRYFAHAKSRIESADITYLYDSLTVAKVWRINAIQYVKFQKWA